MIKISKNITYAEAIHSNTAKRKGIDNTPSPFHVEAMRITAEKIFEPLREWVGGPIKINSFFRGEPTNTAIGGSKYSQHMKGQAMDIDDTFKLIASCIEQVYSEEESWSASDCTNKELVDFIDQLGSKQFKEVENFFATMPKLSHTLKVVNPKTKVENEILLEGLQSFFG